MAKKSKAPSTKQNQIKQASTQTFIAVAVASVIVSMSIIFINLLWGNARYNSKVHGVQEETRDTLQANIDAVGDLEESFRNLERGDGLIPNQPDDKKNSEVVLDALPSQFDFPALAASIANLAKQSGVTFNSFSGDDLGSDATKSSPDPAPQTIPFSVEITGSYTAVGRFLQGLQNSIRPIHVTSLQLTGTNARLRVSVEAETSYQPAFDLDVQTRTVQ